MLSDNPYRSPTTHDSNAASPALFIVGLSIAFAVTFILAEFAFCIAMTQAVGFDLFELTQEDLQFALQAGLYWSIPGATLSVMATGSVAPRYRFLTAVGCMLLLATVCFVYFFVRVSLSMG
jgi:hypothetical protein